METNEHTTNDNTEISCLTVVKLHTSITVKGKASVKYQQETVEWQKTGFSCIGRTLNKNSWASMDPTFKLRELIFFLIGEGGGSVAISVLPF